MGFPVAIAEQALIDCGRHCSICHKFCGIKIELHHIVPSTENGEDSYDNCIPLCFDCHAEVKAYNAKHPKGRMYTASELKRHRNLWYEKVRNSHTIISNPDYLELDRQLFCEIREILPSDRGSINFLRFHDYGASFPCGIHEDLYTFMYKCSNPEFEFMDIDLEGIRARLFELIDKFTDLTGQFTFPVDGAPRKNRVPKEWTYGSREEQVKFNKITNELNELGAEICKVYDELIKLGRRKLSS